jgi:heme-degrading monooxygenase HmoA
MQGIEIAARYTQRIKLSTFSLWESEEALNNYRHSELFSVTWAKTKILFADRPVAFSNLLERDMGFETF